MRRVFILLLLSCSLLATERGIAQNLEFSESLFTEIGPFPLNSGSIIVLSGTSNLIVPTGKTLRITSVHTSAIFSNGGVAYNWGIYLSINDIAIYSTVDTWLPEGIYTIKVSAQPTTSGGPTSVKAAISGILYSIVP